MSRIVTINANIVSAVRPTCRYPASLPASALTFVILKQEPRSEFVFDDKLICHVITPAFDLDEPSPEVSSVKPFIVPMDVA